MGDDLLGDILRATTGEGPVKPAGGGSLGDVLGQAVSRPSRPAAAAAGAVDLAPLAALDAEGAAAFLRYLPADLVIPLLARASVAVVSRLVGAMDADAQAWLRSQSEEIEAVGPERHASAAVKALNLLQRLREDGRLAPASAAAPAAPAAPAAAPAAPVPPRPVQVSTTFAVEAMADAPRPAASEPAPAADPLREVLAQLVDAARGSRSGELKQLAAGLDHPVLAQGLRLVAEGGDAHALDAAIRSLAADHLAAEERRLELMRKALLAIRFGDTGERFRSGT